jgi:CHASE2 domain-containing sensor protein
MSPWGPTAVYLLCLITSLVCAVLLARAWRRTRSKLLLWTALSFGFLALNNLFLVADMIVFADVDLRWLRHLSGLAAISVLLYGFIWEAER